MQAITPNIHVGTCGLLFVLSPVEEMGSNVVVVVTWLYYLLSSLRNKNIIKRSKLPNIIVA